MGELQVIEQKMVPFGDVDLLAVKMTNGKIYAAVKWVCEGIGLSEGQQKAERKKVQEDLVLSKGGRNFNLPTNGGVQEVSCIELDFLPLWLAKISITPLMQQTNPVAVKNLVNYQLKAKDVLAEAFLSSPKLLTEREQLKASMRLSLEMSEEVEALKGEVSEMKEDVEHLKDNIFINSSQAKAIRRKVGENVYEALGGKETNAFKRLKAKTFAACWREFRNYFDISEYRELPRIRFEDAMRFLIAWQPNTELRLEIEHYNTQLQLHLVK
ncbi:ORF6C domain-containing protein [Metasolibacillus meyeri]|uniref:ORF6C domain-containing protein n=1 Tax=Metasolibacillus meyeri TaxID=1071052 RepID=UPI000D30A1BF|nr:ORF6C domain-containing protein [Metasolibacillus meyeri]